MEAEKKRKEEEEKAKAEEERKQKQSEVNRGIRAPFIDRKPPTDAKTIPKESSSVSIFEAEAMEDALEEMAEGGVII